MNYYNENDPFAASWLRALIEDKQIPKGYVDERSIKDVKAKDLEGFAQHHFFAGIGGWSLALKLAGWPEDRPVWTGSCPCQPFSAAGNRKGEDDARHLWPWFKRLIAKRRPSVCFGEQVASADGRLWFSGVRDDLERMGNVVGGADLCSAGVGAPHVRQRIFWVAYADGGNARTERLQRIGQHGKLAQDRESRRRPRLTDDGLGHTALDGWGQKRVDAGRCASLREAQIRQQRPRDDGAFIPCSDGFSRRVEPGIFPLADAGSIRNRMALLRGAGNAINPFLGAEFILAAEEARV